MTVAAWLSKLPMDSINRVASLYGIQANLIAAICMQESSCNPFAERFEPGFRWTLDPNVYAKTIGCSIDTEMNGQKRSYGLMQIMGSVAREHGFRGWFAELYEPDINVDIGTRHLLKFIRKYNDVHLALSAYNAGTPKRLPNGNLVNQSYVNGVMKWKAEADGTSK